MDIKKPLPSGKGFDVSKVGIEAIYYGERQGYCQKHHPITNFNELLAFIKVSEYYKYGEI